MLEQLYKVYRVLLILEEGVELKWEAMAHRTVKKKTRKIVSSPAFWVVLSLNCNSGGAIDGPFITVLNGISDWMYQSQPLR